MVIEKPILELLLATPDTPFEIAEFFRTRVRGSFAAISSAPMTQTATLRFESLRGDLGFDDIGLG